MVICFSHSIFSGSSDHLSNPLGGVCLCPSAAAAIWAARAGVDMAVAGQEGFEIPNDPVLAARQYAHIAAHESGDQLQIVYRNRQKWDAVIRYRDGRYEVPK